MTEKTVTQMVRQVKKEQHRGSLASWSRPIIAIILFFPTGLIVLKHTLDERRLQEQGKPSEAKVSLLKAKHWMQNTVVSFVSLMIAVGLLIMFTANDYSIIRSFVDFKYIAESFPYVLKGFWLNIQVFIVAEITVVLWSLVVAVLRSLPGKAARPIRFLMICYVDLFRGMPEILTILLVVFGLHQTGLPILSDFTDFQAIILALTLTGGAYLGEVMRGAMQQVHPSQVSAARSLGLSYGQTLRYIIIPQAMRMITVPLLNGFVGLQKTTALVSFVGLLDSVNYAQGFVVQQANLSALTGAALCFVVITIPFTRFTDYLEKRDSQKVYGGGR